MALKIPRAGLTELLKDGYKVRYALPNVYSVSFAPFFSLLCVVKGDAVRGRR